jgi:hypothetical protein
VGSSSVKAWGGWVHLFILPLLVVRPLPPSQDLLSDERRSSEGGSDEASPASGGGAVAAAWSAAAAGATQETCADPDAPPPPLNTSDWGLDFAYDAQVSLRAVGCSVVVGLS